MQTTEPDDLYDGEDGESGNDVVQASSNEDGEDEHIDVPLHHFMRISTLNQSFKM